MGVVSHFTDDDTETDTVLHLPKAGQLVRSKLELGLLGPYLAGETSLRLEQGSGVMGMCPTNSSVSFCLGVSHLYQV